MHSPLDAVVQRDSRWTIFTLPQFLRLESFAVELANEFALARREDAHALRLRQKVFQHHAFFEIARFGFWSQQSPATEAIAGFRRLPIGKGSGETFWLVRRRGGR